MSGQMRASKDIDEEADKIDEEDFDEEVCDETEED
jgi:hypothetical protein